VWCCKGTRRLTSAVHARDKVSSASASKGTSAHKEQKVGTRSASKVVQISQQKQALRAKIKWPAHLCAINRRQLQVPCIKDTAKLGDASEWPPAQAGSTALRAAA
jgi:hypothetical protein